MTEPEPSPSPRTGIRVLVADDDEGMRYSVRRGLSRSGFAADAVDNGTAAVEAFGRRPYPVVVLDLMMPGLDGIQTLERIRNLAPDTVVVLMTAHGSVQTAVEAMKLGAADYITKPFELDELLLILDRALEHEATRRENRELRQLIETRHEVAGMVGQSPAMQRVFDRIALLGDNSATVLISGESGTGKELAARAVHDHSRRRQGPFVALNCAALAPSLLESELFGHEAGAYTDAKERREGVIARADGGTLFLDEISEASLPVQTRLESFLQERVIRRLGSDEPQEVDIRVVAASNKDLEQMVAHGQFRRELYFRLNVVPLPMPALRERREDIPMLCSNILRRLRERGQGVLEEISPDALMVLSHHPWPGNVRELQNVLERLTALHPQTRRLDLGDLPDELLRNPEAPESESSFRRSLEHFERGYFTDLLQRSQGNVTEAARAAGISRGHLHRKVKALDLDPEAFRGGS